MGISEKELKNIQYLTLQKYEEIDTAKVELFLAETEQKFMFNGPKPIVMFKALQNKQDFIDFVKEKEWNGYKKTKDEEWANIYAKKTSTLSMHMALAMKDLSKAAEFQVKQLCMLLKVKGLPLTTLQNFVAIMSWITTGYVCYEKFPYGDNPYEPMVEVLKMGLVPRRLKDYWIVGYASYDNLAL